MQFDLFSAASVDNLMELKFFFEGGWGPLLATPPSSAPPPFSTIREGGNFLFWSHMINKPIFLPLIVWQFGLSVSLKYQQSLTVNFPVWRG